MKKTFWERFKAIYMIDLLESFAIAMAISVIIYYVFLIPNIVEGQSMEPNFHNQELLFTDRTMQWFGATDIGKSMSYDYKHKDVVIFNTHGTDLIKRIIAVGGDKIMLKDGEVYLNGVVLKEEYLPNNVKTYLLFRFESTLNEGEEVTVPDGFYFLMGDNRTNSKDSRFKDVGFISRNEIKGRVLLRYWPVNEFTLYTQS